MLEFFRQNIVLVLSLCASTKSIINSSIKKRPRYCSLWFDHTIDSYEETRHVVVLVPG
jgi:hypothetical protein